MRESLFLDSETIIELLPGVMKNFDIEEAFVISTCNRFELIGVMSQIPEDEDHLHKVFQDLQVQGKKQGDDITLSALKENTYGLLKERAVRHIFSVASGLDSLVIGETQITGQFKKAVDAAKKHGTLGPILTRMTQEALRTSGKVRTHTEIGEKPVSISHAAIDLANRVYGHISEHNVTILGAGEMSVLAAKNAIKHQPKSLSIVNRTEEKAKQLVKELNAGAAYPLTDLETVLKKSDIVVSSTAADNFIISAQLIKLVQKVRHHQPLFLIDISLPRNIEPKCSDIDNVYLFDIDDLQQVVSEHIEERRLAAEKAEGIVIDSGIHFENWLNHLSLKPALSGFRSYLDSLMQKEIEKTLKKEIYSGLDDSQISGIRKLLTSIAGKISADAGTRVQAPPEGFYKEQLAQALSALFPISESQEDK